jgi:hypothetical protein
MSPQTALINVVHNASDEAPLRIRVMKTMTHDVIRWGMFEKEILRYMDENEVKTALNLGLIYRDTIIDEKGNHRNVFVFLKDRCQQVTWFKRLIAKVKSFFSWSL